MSNSGQQMVSLFEEFCLSAMPMAMVKDAVQVLPCSPE